MYVGTPCSSQVQGPCHGWRLEQGMCAEIIEWWPPSKQQSGLVLLPGTQMQHGALLTEGQLEEYHQLLWSNGLFVLCICQVKANIPAQNNIRFLMHGYRDNIIQAHAWILVLVYIGSGPSTHAAASTQQRA